MTELSPNEKKLTDEQQNERTKLRIELQNALEAVRLARAKHDAFKLKYGLDR